LKDLFDINWNLFGNERIFWDRKNFLRFFTTPRGNAINGIQVIHPSETADY